MDAKRTKTAIAIRRKVIRLLDRKTLDRLSGMPKPWLADAATVRQAVMIRWPVEAVKAEIGALIDKA